MARMDEWPAWGRWGSLLAGWLVYLGSFWLVFATDALAARVAAVVGICAGLLVLTYSSRAVVNERVRGIDRSQMQWTLPAVPAYIFLMLYAYPRAAHLGAAWQQVLVALTPMLPLLWLAWMMVRYVNRCDEMERRQHLEAAGIAVIVVSVAGMSLGLLAAAGIVAVSGALALLLVLPALCLVYGLACTWSKWRNRAR